MRYSTHKPLLVLMFTMLLVGGGVALYWYQRGDASAVLPPFDSADHRTDESVAQLRLPAPEAPLSDWYMHRQSDTDILYTRTEELPEIGATEGYAYGEQIHSSVMPFDGDVTHPEAWEQIAWIDDKTLVHESEWTDFSDFTVLRVKHDAGGASGEQLTFYLFADDRVYNLSLYPVDEESEQVFIGFVYQYADQLRDMMVEHGDVAPNSFLFGCPNDYQFQITYAGGENQEALLELSGEEVERLSVARSGSGARYTNEDETMVFWEHSGEARIEVDGEIEREQCVIESREVRSVE